MAAIIRRTYKVTHADGRTVTRKYKHWTIQYRDGAGKIRRVKGYTDKEATRQLAAKLERAQARGEEGLVNPYRVHLARPIAEHVAEYLSGLTGKGKDDQYIYATGLRLNRIIDGCGWKRLAD